MLKQTDIEKAVKHRFPEAVALVVCKETNGKVNFCPVGFFSLVAWEPKVWLIALYEKHFSTKVIKETNEFVLCLPSKEQTKDVLYAGSVHGWTVDKTKQVSFKYKPSKFVQPPLIEDSIACFECKVIKQEKVKDHVLFFGEIAASYESGKTWQEKIYNWSDKTLGTMKLGDQSAKIDYSPEGE